MFERFTVDARTVVIHAQEHARRLGHRFIGCEHLLLATAAAGAPVGVALREHGLTPERIEEQIVRRIGLGAGAGLFADLDREALASIGIDLDAVRARIESAFGPDALVRAGLRKRCRRRPRFNPARALPPILRRHLRATRRHVAAAPAPGSRPAPATGRYQATGPVPGGHIPFTPRAKQALQNALHEAQARRDTHIDAEHLGLALLGMNSGMVPPILTGLGASAPTLRAAILQRYRQAS